MFMIVMGVLLPSSLLSGERLSVTSTVANIRSGPGTNHEVLWQLEKYHPLIILEKKGRWYHFKDFEDDSAWVHESLVGKMDTVISIKTNCNVRSGPGPNHDVIFMVEKGVPFKVLQRKGNWVKIEHADGDRGWIYKSLVW